MELLLLRENNHSRKKNHSLNQSLFFQVFNFFKRYQAEHYKRVPSNTEELKKKWNDYNENQKKLAEIKKQEAEAAKLAPKVEEIKPDGDKNEVKKPDVKAAAPDDSSK